MVKSNFRPKIRSSSRVGSDALGVKAGDRLLVVPRGDTVMLLRKPKKYSKAIAGMGKGLFGPGYLAEERESWQ